MSDSNTLDKAIKVIDGKIKELCFIKCYMDRNNKRYLIEDISGYIIKDGFTSIDKAKEWASKNNIKIRV